MHMKKRSFQKSMLMGNTAVVTLVVVVLFICANLYLIHEDAKRIQQQTESNASSILEQIRITIDGVNEICLQLSANSYIIRIFEGLPNLEDNVFEKSPELLKQRRLCGLTSSKKILCIELSSIQIQGTLPMSALR